MQDGYKVRGINTYRAKEDKRDISAWIKLDETKYIESTSQHQTQVEQKIPAMITFTDFARVFAYGNEPQVTFLGGLPLGKHLQDA